MSDVKVISDVADAVLSASVQENNLKRCVMLYQDLQLWATCSALAVMKLQGRDITHPLSKADFIASCGLYFDNLVRDASKTGERP